jgi:hypothetical protein
MLLPWQHVLLKREPTASSASVVEKLLVALLVDRLCQFMELCWTQDCANKRPKCGTVQAFGSNGTNMSTGEGSGTWLLGCDAVYPCTCVQFYISLP